MWIIDNPEDGLDNELEKYLELFANGDDTARQQLMRIACQRMHSMAHRMLRGFPQVRRWDDTDDVVQGASLRMNKAISDVTPVDAKHFISLAALQIRRELLDLSRKHAGPKSYAKNHKINSLRADGEDILKTLLAAEDEQAVDKEVSWTQFHEAAASLPGDEREIFDLVWYFGLQQSEMSRLLGCSLRTVKRRWKETKQRLRERLNGESPE